MATNEELEQRIVRLEADFILIAQALAQLQTIAEQLTALMGEAIGASNPTSISEVLKADPDAEIMTLDGPVKLANIPIGPDGYPEEEWAMKHCPCPKHDAKREALKAKGNDGGIGQYL